MAGLIEKDIRLMRCNKQAVILLVLYSSSFYRPSPRSLQLLGHSPFFTSSVGSAMIYKMLWIGLFLLPLDGFRKAPTTVSLFIC